MQLDVQTQQLLGRYEHTHASSYKYWQVKYIGPDFFEVSFGRIGQVQDVYNVTTKELFKKAKEKLKKGYQKVVWKEIDNYHEKLMLESEIVTAPVTTKKTFKV